MTKHFKVTYSIDNDNKFFSAFIVKTETGDNDDKKIMKELCKHYKELKNAKTVCVNGASESDINDALRKGMSIVTYREV